MCLPSCVRACMQPCQGRLLAEELETLVEAGRDARAGDGDPDREIHGPWLLPQLFAELLQGHLERLCAPRVDRLECVRRRVEDARIEKRGIRLDLPEQKAGEAGELVEPRDLLLDDRRRCADAVRGPVAALLAEVLDEPVTVFVGRERAQV